MADAAKVVPIGGDFIPGRDSSPLIVSLPNTPITVGPLICYEDAFPDLARGSALAGSDVLAVLTNDAWYGEGGAAIQHAALSVLRAVETRRPVLRCGNGGWSGWIDEFGNVRAVLTRNADGLLSTKPDADGTIYFRGTQTVTVTRDSRWVGRNSYYVEHGDWFVAACAVVALLGALTLNFVGASTAAKS